MRIVLKCGTSILVDSSSKLSRIRFRQISDQIKELEQAGHQIILITSGAVAAGYHGTKSINELTTKEKMLAASVGQPILYQKWAEAYAGSINQVGWKTVDWTQLAQLLYTAQDLDLNSPYYTQTKACLLELLNRGILPIVNENDGTTTTELEAMTSFGDNDVLAAQTAVMSEAQLLVNLTDVPGILDSDEEVIPIIPEFTDEIIACLTVECGDKSKGGMMSKVESAQICHSNQIKVVIASGQSDDRRFLVKLVNSLDLPVEERLVPFTLIPST